MKAKGPDYLGYIPQLPPPPRGEDYITYLRVRVSFRKKKEKKRKIKFYI